MLNGSPISRARKIGQEEIPNPEDPDARSNIIFGPRPDLVEHNEAYSQMTLVDWWLQGKQVRILAVE